jgi:hypothetical protein
MTDTQVLKQLNRLFDHILGLEHPMTDITTEIIPDTLDLGPLDDRTLLDKWISFDKDIELFLRHRGRLEYEIQRRMELTNAKMMAHPALTVELPDPAPEYDMMKLMAGLKEVIAPDVYETAVIPPKPQEPKLNMNKAKPWQKLGDYVTEVFDMARQPGKRATLKIGRKE